MSFERRCCGCDECNRNRRRVCEEVKEVGNFEGRRRLNGLREGDKIRVYSGGEHIDGTGVFIRVEDGFLVWVDDHANINVTSLDVISVQRVL
jgi:Zn-dependent alcohol dehydrogenase